MDIEGADPEVYMRIDDGVPLTRASLDELTGYRIPPHTVLGLTRPVGARDHLRGRHNIIMTEWGPWDHEAPMLRLRQKSGSAHEYEVFGAQRVVADIVRGEVGVQITQPDGPSPQPMVVRITGPGPGLHPYEVVVRAGDLRETISGAIVQTEWDVRFWSWRANPLEDVEAWRREAQGEGGDDIVVLRATVPALNFVYGHGGPRDVGISDEISQSSLGADAFAMIASTRMVLTAGRWRLSTLSDDGVRVLVDGEQVIERWDIHGPTPDEAIIEIDRTREVEFTVEHFENDGYAVLVFEIGPAE